MSINFTKTMFVLPLFVLILMSSDIFAQEGDWHTETNNGIIHRHECSFTQCNGKLYLLGGRRLGIEKYTDVFDPLTGTWSHGTHKPPIFELHHFQAVTYNDKIYIIGAFTGNHPNETSVDRVYIYNTADDTWSEGAMIPEGRRRGAAGAVLYNDKIYIVGGAAEGHVGGNTPWLDEYNPATQEWKTLTDAPRARDHFQAAVAGNKLYLAGGRRSILIWDTAASKYKNADELVYEVDVYDFTTGTWEVYPNNLPTGRAGTAAVILNNDLIVMGGESNSQTIAHNETEAMDLIEKTWRPLIPLDTGRHATHALVYNNEAYIVSGAKSRGGSSSSELNSMEVLSLSAIHKIELSAPSEINFEEVVQNEIKSIAVNIINSPGNASVTISKIALLDNDNNQFSIVNPPSVPYVLNGGATLTLNVKFDPSILGVHSGEMEIDHSGDNDPISIILKGESVLEITNIKNESELNALIMYPNPVQDLLMVGNISTKDNLVWSIADENGCVLKTGQSAFKNKCYVDFTKINHGIYILNLKNTISNSSRSILIKKD